MYSLSWFFSAKTCSKKTIRLLSYSTKYIKHGVGYKWEHDAWECTIEILLLSYLLSLLAFFGFFDKTSDHCSVVR